MSEVVTVGVGSVSGVPDLFLLHAGLSTRAQSAAEALARMTELDAQARDVLDSMGIAAQDRSTASYAIEAVHDHRTGKVEGYAATVGMRLSLREPAAVAAVTARLADEVGDSLRVHGLAMTFDDPSQLIAEARAAAVRAARQQAEQIAGAAGARIGRLVSLAEGTGHERGPVRTFRRAAAMSSGPEIQPGEADVQVTVTGTWELDTGGSPG